MNPSEKYISLRFHVTILTKLHRHNIFSECIIDFIPHSLSWHEHTQSDCFLLVEVTFGLNHKVQV